jgi:hypothetical protein
LRKSVKKTNNRAKIIFGIRIMMDKAELPAKSAALKA